MPRSIAEILLALISGLETNSFNLASELPFSPLGAVLGKYITL